jgi:hypothetical protein
MLFLDSYLQKSLTIIKAASKEGEGHLGHVGQAGAMHYFETICA